MGSRVRLRAFSTLTALSLTLAACSGVDNPADALRLDGTTDVARTDVQTDVTNDAPADNRIEMDVPSPMDAPTDTSIPNDVPIDVPGDVAQPDAPGDAPADVASDAPRDVPVDTATDVPVDTATPGCIDNDGDRYGVGPMCLGTDCDDRNAAVHPDAAETCNNVDDDCNAMIDDGLGTVSCGMGACARTVPACVGGRANSCVIGTPSAELCDNIDNDCDGMIDEDFGAISCGLGACRRTVSPCMGGMMTTCTPGMPTLETCNNIDDDCNGFIDEGLGTITCGVGACERTVDACVSGRANRCTPGTPGTEVCNGLDDDCDTMVDEELPSITCGNGPCRVTVPGCAGGSTTMCTPDFTQSRSESCNNMDDDCDGMIDDGIADLSCGNGLCRVTVPACSMGAPNTCMPNSGAAITELCGNGIDEDCDGSDLPCVSNDVCSGAINLIASNTAVVVMGNTVRSSNSAGSCAAGNDLFYTFTLTARSIVYADTFGSAFDTHVGLLAGGCSATPVCNDNAGCASDAARSQLTAVLGPGTHYLVVDGASGAMGDFTLRLAAIPVAGTARGTVPMGSYSFMGDTTGAPSLSPPACGYGGGGGDHWWYWTTCPNFAGGNFVATTCSGARWDTMISLRMSTGTSTCSDNHVPCDPQSRVDTTLPAGANLFVLTLDGYGALGDWGRYTMTGMRP